MGLYGSAWLACCVSPLEQDLSRVPAWMLSEQAEVEEPERGPGRARRRTEWACDFCKCDWCLQLDNVHSGGHERWGGDGKGSGRDKERGAEQREAPCGRGWDGVEEGRAGPHVAGPALKFPCCSQAFILHRSRAARLTLCWLRRGGALGQGCWAGRRG